MSRIYFPLRSSVEFFEAPARVAPAAQAKQAAVLFEEVVFQDGLLLATIGEEGNWTVTRPRHELTDEDLAEGPRGEIGERFVISAGVESTPGVPAETMHTMMDTTIQRSYAAQWHSSAIDELEKLDVPWAHFGSISEDDVRRLARPIDRLTREFASAARETGLESMQVDYAAKALARDVVTAAELGATMNITPLFAPMLVGVGAETKQVGDKALGLLVDDLSARSWEEIADFRDHPGCVDVRGKLREFERLALEQEPSDATDYLVRVQASINDALLAASVEDRANVPKAIGRELALAVVSVIPIIGGFIGAAAGVADAVGERAEQRQRWNFALMKLKRD